MTDQENRIQQTIPLYRLRMGSKSVDPSIPRMIIKANPNANFTLIDLSESERNAIQKAFTDQSEDT